MPLTQVQPGMLGTPQPYNFKNRIINGAMTFDQRNAGTATANTINGYVTDRWQVIQTTTGKLIAQQNAGSVTPPVGFVNYLGTTSQSAFSVGSSDVFAINQYIEGYNIADLGWGTANAKTVTLSFQVYSSLTGTFGGALGNSGKSRSYPFTYSIPVANTWTSISVTIAGDTSGTWLTTTGAGIAVDFGLGVGSTFSGTAGSWSGNNYWSATGATSVVGTNGATFYITGVQLEVGSSATGFDYRPYGTELALCQRYYVNGLNYVNGFTYSATTGIFGIIPPVTFRATPTVGYTSGATVSVDFIGGTQNATISIAAGGAYASTKGISLTADGLAGRTTWQGIILVGGNWFLSAEL
jgi:hypothetical protein